MIRCDCAVCRSSDPRDKRTRASIYLQTPECAIVVDTGTDFRTQCLRENIWQVDAVIMTHAHTDHVMGFDDLRRFAAPRGGQMPVYASAETMADLERVYEFAFKTPNPSPGYLKPEPHIISGAFSLGETTITPLPVPHGSSETYGYLFSRQDTRLLAYLSDCSAVPNEIARQDRGRAIARDRRPAPQTASDPPQRCSGPRSGAAGAAGPNTLHPYLSRAAAERRERVAPEYRPRLRRVENRSPRMRRLLFASWSPLVRQRGPRRIHPGRSRASHDRDLQPRRARLRGPGPVLRASPPHSRRSPRRARVLDRGGNQPPGIRRDDRGTAPEDFCRAQMVDAAHRCRQPPRR